MTRKKSAKQYIAEALQVLAALDMPRAQQNERSALCLLALIDLIPGKAWNEGSNPLIGVSPIMEWAEANYKKSYAPNTRETIRRQTLHQFLDAGLALYNPDKLDRPVNSPHAVYQIAPDALNLLRTFGTPTWRTALESFQSKVVSLAARYAKERDMHLVPVSIAAGQTIQLSAGEHSELIKSIVEQFAPRFAPGSDLIYVGDTGDRWGYFAKPRLKDLGVVVDNHGKMPDVVLFYAQRNWLFLIESVTSHGPVDSKRHDELSQLFKASKAGLVFVTAFPSRRVMVRYLTEISWETEVWCAEAPTHLIHFNGDRFCGPR